MNDRGSPTAKIHGPLHESVTSIRSLLATARSELPTDHHGCREAAALLRSAELEMARLAIDLDRVTRGHNPLTFSTHAPIEPPQ